MTPIPLVKGVEYDVLSIGPMKLAGLPANVRNDEPDAIKAAWDAFFAKGGLEAIPNRANDNIFGVYCQYESDHTDPYTLIIGAQVESFDGLPKGYAELELPQRRYAVAAASGAVPDCVVKMWERIHATRLGRDYVCDFDIYPAGMDAANAEVKICVGVE